MQAAYPHFFTTTPDHRIYVLQEKYFIEAKTAFLESLGMVEQATGIKVQKNLRRKPARRLPDGKKYADTIARQVGL